jgi:hypothetical protein
MAHARSMTVGIVVLGVLAGCGEPSATSPAPGDSSSAAATSTTPAASAASESDVLLLTATGTATVDTLTYVVDDQTVEERSVPLPWSKSLSIPSDGDRHVWKLTVQHRGGNLEVVATVNGSLVTKSGGGGTGTGTASLSGSIDG